VDFAPLGRQAVQTKAEAFEGGAKSINVLISDDAEKAVACFNAATRILH
jgi:hypothetical protein